MDWIGYLLEITKLAQMLDTLLSWKFLSVCFFVTSALLLFAKIPFLSIINNMNTIITWIWVLSVIGLTYKITAYTCMKVNNYICERVSEHKQIEEHKKFTAELSNKVNLLSSKEKQVLAIVKGGDGSGVWVPVDNAEVLTLLHKGMLEKISNIERFHEWKFSYDREVCMLVIIPEALREYI